MESLFTIELGIALIALAGFALFRWGFRNLTGEEWQIAFAIPARISGSERQIWPAINFTFYGVFSSIAYGLSTLAFVFLIGASGQPLGPTAVFAGILLAVGVPASKWVARWVEGIPGHTIGGAVFAVVVCSIPAMAITQWLTRELAWPQFDAAVVVAAACLAYVLGEAVGRLACLSFGCCYGRPIAQSTSLQKALYSRLTETYRGRFKKIAYAGGLTDRPVIAVQSIACAVLFAMFLLSLWLFWKGMLAASIVVSFGLSQLWRAYSEQLRADFRGREGFTLYQGMAIVAALLSIVLAWMYASGVVAPTPSAYLGWKAVAQLEVILVCQALALLILFYMGRSSVTSSRLELLLNEPAKR
jgi:hypothetical protein